MDDSTLNAMILVDSGYPVGHLLGLQIWRQYTYHRNAPPYFPWTPPISPQLVPVVLRAFVGVRRGITICCRDFPFVVDTLLPSLGMLLLPRSAVT
jgi:hypothetical protein